MNIDDNDKNNLPDDIKLDLDHELSQDFSLDAPDLEPAPAQEPSPKKSQAVKDLENMEDQRNLDAQAGGGGNPAAPPEPILSAAKEKVKKAKTASNPGAPRGYRWFFVHLLSLLGLVAWAATSFISSEPYRWEAALIALAVVVLTIPTMKKFHVRTRAGLAGLGAALGLAVCSLYNPDIQLLPGLPLAFVWLLILTVTWVWLIVAILRNENMRKNKVALVLSALLIYPMLAPIFAIVDGIFVQGMPISEFSLKYLSESPEFLTMNLPWFFWPQTFLAFLIPPLAAIFLLKDQLGYRKTDIDRFHLGALWLSLAGFVVLIYSVFSINPIAEDYPDTVKALRNLWPAAAQYQETQVAKLAAANPAPIAKPKPAPAAPAPETPAPETPATDAPPAQPGAAPAPDAAAAEPAADVAPEAAPEPPATDVAEAGPAAPGVTEPAPVAAVTEPGAPAEATTEVAATEPEAPAAEAAVPVAEPGPATRAPAETTGDIIVASATEPAVRESQTDSYPEPVAAPQAAAPEAQVPETPEPTDDTDELGLIMPKNLEVGTTDSRFAPERDGDSAAILVLPPDGDAPETTLSEMVDKLSYENQTLKNDNASLNQELTELRSQIAVLRAQNQLLMERLNYDDQLIINLTTPR
ncbi:MAG: hypothetical protein LBF58_02735 [Deltaproteobacteria bacterium]|jgi:hypothetical protein|nr:hypothetical protein [Deltaproteobacteria bacterium]